MNTHTHHHLQSDPRINFFDLQAPGWERNAAKNAYNLSRLDELRARLGLRPSIDVVEVGCGTGLVTGWLVNCVQPGRVLAVDFSPAMLAQAQAKRLAAEFRCLDICHEAPAAGAFDLAFCFQVFPHFRDQTAALRNLARALKPGGRLVVVHLVGRAQLNEFHRGLAEPVHQDRLPAPHEWPALLATAGLELVRCEDRADLFLVEAKCGWVNQKGRMQCDKDQ
ncbi:MAG: Trans-aconitate 2-methyltransferase [Verrucomicrobiae bacterium]|nr:Trans-aconitate 2-methyltransferase [Verrucomicrobiae bacterium]